MRAQVVYSYAPFLSFKFEDELLRYNDDLYGISRLPPRWWLVCVMCIIACFRPLCKRLL